MPSPVSRSCSMPDPAATAAGSPGPPAWVLLDTLAYIGRRRNATTATAMTSGKHIIEVSFVLADPPGVSVCYVHCPGTPEGGGVDGDFDVEHEILTSTGPLVLISMDFTFCDGQDNDYFVYRAGPGPPSLHLLPRSYERSINARKHVGILPTGGGDDGGGEHFVVVSPVLRTEPRAMYYDLHIFSSETGAWRAKAARLDAGPETSYHRVCSHRLGKAMAAGAGSLAWFDPWHGVLLCDNVLGEDPLVRLIQLPSPPPPRNVPIDGREVRDATVSSDGVITFVEVKFHNDGDNSDDEVYDAVAADHGWTATIWDRAICSGDWRKRVTVDTADVSVAADEEESGFPGSLPAAWGGEANKPAALRRVRSATPALSVRADDDVVYMMYRLAAHHPKAWVLAVDARNKTVEAHAQFDASRICWFHPTYLASAFSMYLHQH
ncbi:hypothetical protein EJB05_07824, partial [Eragrostis curvula]